MKLREMCALGLGIAVPLWLRQYQFERASTATQQQFMRRTVDDLNEALKGHERWAERLQKEIQRAFQEGAAGGTDR